MLVLLGGVVPPREVEAAPPPKELAAPVEDGDWLRPAPGNHSEPVWGVKGGIAVGIWPASGPRGLLRVYAPYLGQKHPRMVNYISVEPTVDGVRGQSELEHSKLDDTAGKAMWSCDALEPEPKPRHPWEPAAGKVVQVGSAKTLTFYVAVEQFKNGARPVIQVTLRQDRPHELSLRVFSSKGGAVMDACVLSATMGNYARLRHLWLKGQVVEAGRVWPTFKPDDLGFTSWREWPAERLFKAQGDAIVAATCNEADPAKADYADDVPPHWRYQGKPATQFWRAPTQKGLVVRVNGRKVFWGGKGEIPGGVAFENFELQAPFKSGQEFRFGVTPEGPETLGFDLAWRKKLTGGP